MCGAHYFCSRLGKACINGVIGANKSDSIDVIDLIIGNLKEPKLSKGITALSKSRHEVIYQTAGKK